MELYAIPISGTEGPDKFILYRPLAGLAFVGNRAMLNLARSATPGEAAQGTAQAFLSAIGYFTAEHCPPEPAATEFHPTTAVLLLTNQCQLRCVYCYAAAGEMPRHDLTFELARTAIDYVCQSAQALGRPRFEISFHGGGEPTYAWSLLQACVRYARQQPLPAQISVTTNGIWSAQQCAWILANLNGLTLSLDGGPAIQNRQRPFRSGNSSAAQVLRTVAELDRHKFSYGMRLTATAPWSNLVEAIRFLCAETGCRSMQVEPAFNTERGGHGLAETAEVSAFVTALLEATELATQAGRHLHYSGARLGQVTRTFCTAPREALIVNADGDLVACYEVTARAHPLSALSRLGHIENGVVHVDQAARDRLHGLMAERRAGCRDCFCFWSCAGDCYTRTFAPGEQGHLRRETRCEINRQVMQQLLLRGIAQGQGVWRQAPRQGAPRVAEAGLA
jgi:uncharacterized protein